MIVRKLVDTSCLESERLERFLARSRQHQVVLCELALLEMSKGDAVVNTACSTEILSKYLGQVFLLKSMKRIARLRPRRRGLQRRLIDMKATQGFRNMCVALHDGRPTDPHTISFLRARQEHAEETYLKVSAFVDEFRITPDLLAKSYSANDLRSLRSGEPTSDKFIVRFGSDVWTLTKQIMAKTGSRVDIPIDNARYSIEFRTALCVHLMTMDWVLRSGYQKAKAASLTNTNIDMLHAAHATLFDGLISADDKLKDIYCSARAALKYRLTERAFVRFHS